MRAQVADLDDAVGRSDEQVAELARGIRRTTKPHRPVLRFRGTPGRAAHAALRVSGDVHATGTVRCNDSELPLAVTQEEERLRLAVELPSDASGVLLGELAIRAGQHCTFILLEVNVQSP